MAPGERRNVLGLAIIVVAGVLGVVGTLTLVLAVGRKTPEQIALASARKEVEAGHARAAFEALRECAVRFAASGTGRAGCACADKAIELATDLTRFSDGIRLARATGRCTSALRSALAGEFFVGLGNPGLGIRSAEEALKENPNEPHALFAKAWALSLSGPSPEAIALAERAVKGGRGLPALLLLGTLRSAAGDAAGARDAIQAAVPLAPDDPRVAYDLGVVEQGASHYREAREAYLHALALDPKLADARANLAVLTHSVGADDEARHDVDELAAIAPNDPRIPALRATLSAKAAPH